ncbi:MAG: RecB-family nuclease [Candidatus Heimdallarchaeaceae archaeon]
MSSGKIIVQLHNFSSINHCREFVRIALSLGARDIVLSKATGTGATTGIPIAQKLAHAQQANLLYLQGIDDSIELIQPDEIYLFIKRPFSKETFNPQEITELYKSGKNILLIFGGSDPGLTKQELEKGKAVYFEKLNELGCLGEITLALYLLRTLIEE